MMSTIRLFDYIVDHPALGIITAAVLFVSGVALSHSDRILEIPMYMWTRRRMAQTVLCFAAASIMCAVALLILIIIATDFYIWCT